MTKAERIRNAWMEYQRAMNELQVTLEMGIYAPGLVEKVIQKKKEWLEAQGKERSGRENTSRPCPKYKGASRKGGAAKIRSKTFPGIARAMAEQWR